MKSTMKQTNADGTVTSTTRKGSGSKQVVTSITKAMSDVKAKEALKRERKATQEAQKKMKIESKAKAKVERETKQAIAKQERALEVAKNKAIREDLKAQKAVADTQRKAIVAQSKELTKKLQSERVDLNKKQLLARVQGRIAKIEALTSKVSNPGVRATASPTGKTIKELKRDEHIVNLNKRIEIAKSKADKYNSLVNDLRVEVEAVMNNKPTTAKKVVEGPAKTNVEKLNRVTRAQEADLKRLAEKFGEDVSVYGA